MTAREQAEQDIREYCKQTSVTFMAFRTELDEPMEALVNEWIEEQSKLS